MGENVREVVFGVQPCARMRPITSERDTRLARIAMDFVSQLPDDAVEALRVLEHCRDLLAYSHKVPPPPCKECEPLAEFKDSLSSLRCGSASS